MNTKRLLKLADILDTIERKKFDISYFTNGNNINECGSTACALGHAGYDKSFRRAGFKTNALSDRVTYKVGNETLENFHAAACFFDIDYFDATILFGDNTHENYGMYAEEVTPKIVAKKIRKFVKAELSMY